MHGGMAEATMPRLQRKCKAGGLSFNVCINTGLCMVDLVGKKTPAKQDGAIRRWRQIHGQEGDKWNIVLICRVRKTCWIDALPRCTPSIILGIWGSWERSQSHDGIAFCSLQFAHRLGNWPSESYRSFQVDRGREGGQAFKEFWAVFKFISPLSLSMEATWKGYMTLVQGGSSW